MCVYTTTDPPGIRLFLRLPASRTSPDTRPLSKEERWHWSHSGVKVTFIHRTWRSHRLPHTPYLCSFFIVHSHYILLFSFFLPHLNMPFPAFFPVSFLCSFERLPHVWILTPSWTKAVFVRDFLIMGLTEDIWVIQNFTILVPTRWVQSYHHFWFACVSLLQRIYFLY